jgi:hypothetical protein
LIVKPESRRGPGPLGAVSPWCVGGGGGDTGAINFDLLNKVAKKSVNLSQVKLKSECIKCFALSHKRLECLEETKKNHVRTDYSIVLGNYPASIGGILPTFRISSRLLKWQLQAPPTRE